MLKRRCAMVLTAAVTMIFLSFSQLFPTCCLSLSAYHMKMLSAILLPTPLTGHHCHPLYHLVSSLNFLLFQLIFWLFMIGVAPVLILWDSAVKLPLFRLLTIYFSPLLPKHKDVVILPFVPWQMNFSKILWEGTTF